MQQQSTSRLRVRWAKRSYPACETPTLADLTCPRRDRPLFSAQGVKSVRDLASGLTPLFKHTLSGASSTCNDGSPAVMYIRPALEVDSQSDDGDKWLIHLQGGRNCTHADDCGDRWCSAGSQAAYSAGKMSSTGLPPAIRSQGIFSSTPQNDFRSYHQVFVYYCSSDNWIGNADSHIYSSQHGDYSIAFRGAAIVADVIRTLKSDTGTWSDPLDGSDRVHLPDIDHATQVLLTGSSAGSIGLRHHVDRLQRQLTRENPNVRVQAVFDVAFLPSLQHEAIDWSYADSPAGYLEWLTEGVIVPFPDAYAANRLLCG